MFDSYISITDKNKKIFKDGTTCDGTAKEEVEPRGTTKFSLPFSVLAVSQHKFKKRKRNCGHQTNTLDGISWMSWTDCGGGI